MDSERLERARQIHEHARELDAMGRASYLEEACSGDQEIRNEVELMIVSELETVGSFPKSGGALQSDRIGPYRVLRKLGQGGMGAVYLAQPADESSMQQVAIKVIKRGMDTEEILGRFRREQKILGTLDHPNIARLIEAGMTEDRLPYFVMEYVPGESIDQHCDRLKLDITERLTLFRLICSAVHYAHQNLVVHRDLKPGNILVTSEGVPKLLDFGIAKILTTDLDEHSALTATGLLVMTPDYASPEQVRGEPITTASDIYSLGVLLYQFLTGHLPYRLATKNPAEMVRIIGEEEPEKPSTVIGRTTGAVSPEEVASKRDNTPQKLQKIIEGDLDQIVLMAMRKEPQRRYQSADQFSEDLRRYLENLPIRARKDTFFYRSAKFVRRNKFAVAISAVAFLAILISVFIAGIIQLRANQQAKLFQEFGQEVTRIEAVMRFAYLLPLHDIQPDKKQVQDRLEVIRQRMKVLGGVAHGPGHYSLGRGYLSLHRYQDAYDNLILAWEKYHYQEPIVAGALGLSLAMLYREKLQEAERLYEKDLLEQRKKALEKEYRDPALRYIQQGKSASSPEPPEYVDALLAFLSKQYPESLRKADSAAQKSSWLYEAKVLKGDVLAAWGSDQNSTGKTDIAADFLNQSKSAYFEAAEKGQSDPEIYNGLCAVHSILQANLMDQTGTSPDAVINEGLGYCKKALRADSGNLRANLLIASIYSSWAYDRIVNGKDPAESVQNALQFANAALKIDPENGLAHRVLGYTHNSLASAEIHKQGNPIPMLEKAEANFEKASSKMPFDYDLMTARGTTLVDRARFDTYAGKDPRPILAKAIAILRKALGLNLRHFKSYSNLGTAYYAKGAYEIEAGLDPKTSLDEAISLFKKSTEINPNYVNAYQYIAVANLSMSEYAKDRGEDPIPFLDESITAYKKSLVLSPGDAFGLVGMATAFTKKADRLQRMGTGATSELESGRDAFRESLKANDQIILTYVYYAELELIAARYALADGRSPDPFFAEAQKILKSALAINPNCPECLESVASLHLMRAEQGQSKEKDIHLGIAAADEALKQNPQLAKVYALRGQLLLLRAQSLSGKKGTESAQEAMRYFDQAFKIKESLKREFGNAWEKAKQLSS